MREGQKRERRAEERKKGRRERERLPMHAYTSLRALSTSLSISSSLPFSLPLSLCIYAHNFRSRCALSLHLQRAAAAVTTTKTTQRRCCYWHARSSSRGRGRGRFTLRLGLRVCQCARQPATTSKDATFAIASAFHHQLDVISLCGTLLKYLILTGCDNYYGQQAEQSRAAEDKSAKG